MYDDIAYNGENKFQGQIFNHPNGSDVYKGVVKDYTGGAVSSDNFYAVLAGNKSAVVGGSGKVLESGPNDHVFVFCAGHGALGVLAMSVIGDYIYADLLDKTLRGMYANKHCKSLLFYLDAGYSASMFMGFRQDNMNVYAVTASKVDEPSWATYCPHDDYLPHGLDTCVFTVFLGWRIPRSMIGI